jgi:hypothetical protein
MQQARDGDSRVIAVDAARRSRIKRFCAQILRASEPENAAALLKAFFKDNPLTWDEKNRNSAPVDRVEK